MGLELDGLLIDLDGTVYQEGDAIPGAGEALKALRRRGIPWRFVTNTTRAPRSALVTRLETLGIPALPAEILTAPLAAAGWLRARGARRVMPLLAQETWPDLEGLEVDEKKPEWVVVGDLGEVWSYEILNRAFRRLLAGARLLALQRNRYWRREDGLALDAGPFVAALEYASGQQAVLAGKPSPAFFEAAVDHLGLSSGERVAMVGDDLESDVEGARTAGLLAIAVRTGKYRPEAETETVAAADLVLDSLADLPAVLA